MKKIFESLDYEPILKRTDEISILKLELDQKQQNKHLVIKDFKFEKIYFKQLQDKMNRDRHNDSLLDQIHKKSVEVKLTFCQF